MHAIVAAGIDRDPVNRGHSKAIVSRAAADRAKRPPPGKRKRLVTADS